MEHAIESALRREVPSDRDAEQERVWIQATRKGDPAAFNRLVLKWERPIYNLVLRMLGNREDAAETTQEVFLSAFRNIAGFKRQARFSTWLYRIAVNHCITRLRRRPLQFQTWEEEATSHELQGASSPTWKRQDEEVIRIERQRIVRRSLARLSPVQRVVVELKFYREETFSEISEILNLPESTVKSRFYAALDLLKGCLGELE